MERYMKKRIAVCLVLCILLTGCARLDFGGYFQNLFAAFSGATSFDRMQYTRPDMQAFGEQLDAVCDLVASAQDVEDLVDGILDFYTVFDDFSTAYALSMIRYYCDLTDEAWAQEYEFCLAAVNEANAGLDRLMRSLAASPLRAELEAEEYFGAGYFEAYDGQGIYSEEFLALLARETELLSEYYTVSAEATQEEYYSEAYFSVYGEQMAQVYVELIALRQEMAASLGYADYPTLAYDLYFRRDYTPAQATAYLADIRAELSPLYTRLLEGSFYTQGVDAAQEAQMYDYVSSMADAMGGLIGEAFDRLEAGRLYDISYSENKYNASFEVYLPSYYQPFVFVDPTGTAYDCLTFAHEFGHFCSDYHSYGSAAGVDVAEIFSQGMEYLSLCYAEGGEALASLKMADSLCLYVEQAALASFEQQVYTLTGDDLTTENVRALYEQVCTDYGVTSDGWDSRSYVTVTHYFTDPMYVVSYVVSNDAALQLYQMEQAQRGTGLACLESNLTTTQGYFLAFLQEVGLQSPFEPARLTQVRELFEQTLLS